MANYELRTLQASDIFPMVKILNKIGFKNIKEYLTPDKIKEFTSFLSDSATADLEAGDPDEKTTDVVTVDPEDSLDQKITMVGFTFVMDVAGILLENLPSCENEIYSFLASVAGVKVNEIRTMGMGTFMDLLVDVLKKEEFMDFFKAVSRLLK